MKKEKAILLLSGGLDSALTLVKGNEIYEIILALTFDYGQQAARKERAVAVSLASEWQIPHRFISLEWLTEIDTSTLQQKRGPLPFFDSFESLDSFHQTTDSAKSVWVPNRNGLFLNIAACFADAWKATVVLTGFNAEEAVTFPDNSIPFMKSMTDCFSYSTRSHPRVESLVANKTKTEMVAEAIRLQFDFAQIWSCYRSPEDEKMCGKCESCVRLKRALHENTVLEKWSFIFG